MSCGVITRSVTIWFVYFRVMTRQATSEQIKSEDHPARPGETILMGWSVRRTVHVEGYLNDASGASSWEPEFEDPNQQSHGE